MVRYKVIGTCVLGEEKLGVRIFDKVDCKLYDMTMEKYEKISNNVEDVSNLNKEIRMIDIGDKITTQYEIEHGEVKEGVPFNNIAYTFNSMIRDMNTLLIEGWDFDIEAPFEKNITANTSDVFTARKDMFMVQFDGSQLDSDMKYNVVRVWGYNVRLETPSILNTENIIASHKVCSICRLKKSKLIKKKFVLICEDCLHDSEG